MICCDCGSDNWAVRLYEVSEGRGFVQRPLCYKCYSKREMGVYMGKCDACGQKKPIYCEQSGRKRYCHPCWCKLRRQWSDEARRDAANGLHSTAKKHKPA